MARTMREWLNFVNGFGIKRVMTW